MNIEIWKDVKGYEGIYEVSSFGRVRSVDRFAFHWRGGKRIVKGKILIQCNRGEGYLCVDLSKKSKKTTYLTHRIVAISFLGLNKKLEVNHKDSNRHNNSIENLEWSTRSENMKHASIFGNHNAISSPKMAKKLNVEKVLSIRLKSLNGISQRDIAKEFSIARSNVCSIVNRKTWKNI